MLQEMGGEGSVPDSDDTVDMVTVLRELAMPDVGLDWDSDDGAGDLDSDSDDDDLRALLLGGDFGGSSGSSSSGGGGSGRSLGGMIEDDRFQHLALTDGNPPTGGNRADFKTPNSKKQEMNAKESSSSSRGGSDSAEKERRRRLREAKRQGGQGEEEEEEDALLHSGPLLGDLPSLSSGGRSGGKKKSPTQKERDDIGGSLANLLKSDGRTDGKFNLSPASREALLQRRRLKKKKKKRVMEGVGGGGAARQAQGQTQHPDMPTEFLCALSQGPMSDPVLTPYGHHFERRVIEDWMNKQGRICPVTGGPLAETDIRTDQKLQDKIRKWLLLKSMGEHEQRQEQLFPSQSASAVPTTSSGPTTAASITQEETDALYDF
jgi:hypothetical protein